MWSGRRPELEHRPDERSHHVPEEAVRGDGEVQALAVALPCRREHRPGEDLVLGLGRRERAEVVLSQEQRGRRYERVDIGRSRPAKRASTPRAAKASVGGELDIGRSGSAPRTER